MYSLDVNFLKDRPSFTKNSGGKKPTIAFPTGNLTPIYIGVGVGLFLPTLLGISLWILQGKNGELEQNIVKLEQQNQELEAKIGNINKIKEETNKIKDETQSLVGVFDSIRPWSAMLQDLRDRIPTTAQIEIVKQIAPSTTPTEGQPVPSLAGGLEITGFARTFNDVNDYLLSLQQSGFLRAIDTKITTAELVDAPIDPVSASGGVVIKPPKIVKYTIQSSLSDVRASELIRELEQKGTVGLVTRLRTLQQTGVIQR